MNLKHIFPYSEFRKGQEELIRKVYTVCINRKTLAIEAFNGFGKTICIVCGALAAAKDMKLRVIYSCRTKRQVARVIEELTRVQARIGFVASYLSSKSDYCLLLPEERFSLPKTMFSHYCNFKTTNNLCNYYLKFYHSHEKAADIIQELSSKIVQYPELMRLGAKEGFCPYELQKVLLSSSQFIVLTYDYLIEEKNLDMLYNAGFTDGETIVVFDEAHNLEDFIFDKNIYELEISDITKAADEMAMVGFRELSDALRYIEDKFEAHISGNGEGKQSIDKLLQSIYKDKDKLWLNNIVYELTNPRQSSWLAISLNMETPVSTYRCGFFLNKMLCSKKPVLYYSSGKLYLADLQENISLASFLRRFRTVILASATLSPPELFLRRLGLERVDTYIAQKSESVSCLTLIDRSVTTEFKYRNSDTYRRIAHKISLILEAVSGNSCVFTTSYSQIHEITAFLPQDIRSRTLFEKPDLSLLEASEIVDKLAKKKNLVLFGVQGGRFAEGEDAAFGNTTAVVVVGLPMHPPNPRLFIRYLWLKNHGVDNPHFNASVLPALRKTIQAAGRGIRSESRKAVIVLLDKRFDNPQLIELMPEWMTENMVSKDWGPEIKHTISKYLS